MQPEYFPIQNLQKNFILKSKSVMSFNVTALLLAIMLFIWQVLMWKKIKLKKWQDYAISAIMVLLMVWFVYLIFLS